MKLKLLALAITTVVSINASAVSFDYRHEMTDKVGNTHKDRLLMSNRFANGFGLSMEGKWKGYNDSKDKAFNENVSNGLEVTASWLYKFDKTFAAEGGFNLVSESGSSNYRPYIRGEAKVVDDVVVSLRYRPFYKRYSSNIGTTKDTSETGYTLTSYISYDFLQNFNLTYEIEYHKSNSADFTPIANNESYDWTHDFKLAYKIDKNWKPYAAIGNVSGSKYTDERQTRYRVGVVYSF